MSFIFYNNTIHLYAMQTYLNVRGLSSSNGYVVWRQKSAIYYYAYDLR